LRPPQGQEIAVTTDFLLETKHFRRDWHSPESAGHRALARGLSDLAAMGAKPMAAFLSLALPEKLLAEREGRRWVERFFAGLQQLAERWGTTLAGGDTASSPCDLILADIVLVGAVAKDRALRRSGGRSGDVLYVTGRLGGAAAELQQLSRGKVRDDGSGGGKRAGTAACAHPQLYPEPRLGVGQALVRRGLARAAIDLSDGLSTDLAHLCRESGLGAEMEEAAIPIHPLAISEARTSADAVALALNGGEDYELLFAAGPEVRMPRTIGGVPVTRVGRLVPGSGVALLRGNGRSRKLKPGGWEHLSGKQ
jgi:thiamine-monophosphate kinase